MRSLVFEFDASVLWPLIVFFAIVLWRSVRLYRSSQEILRHREPGYRAQVAAGEVEADLHDLISESGLAKDRAVQMAQYSILGILVAVGVMLLNNKLKMNVASLTWKALGLVSILSFLYTLWEAWRFSREASRMKLLLCLLAMLLAAGSTFFFMDKQMYAHHALCPHCSEDDDERPPYDPDY